MGSNFAKSQISTLYLTLGPKVPWPKSTLAQKYLGPKVPWPKSTFWPKSTLAQKYHLAELSLAQKYLLAQKCPDPKVPSGRNVPGPNVPSGPNVPGPNIPSGPNVLGPNMDSGPKQMAQMYLAQMSFWPKRDPALLIMQPNRYCTKKVGLQISGHLTSSTLKYYQYLKVGVR
jgi:hypothetical protein